MSRRAPQVVYTPACPRSAMIGAPSGPGLARSRRSAPDGRQLAPRREVSVYLDQAPSSPVAGRSPGDGGTARTHGAEHCFLCTRVIAHDEAWANVYAGETWTEIGAVHETCWAAFLSPVRPVRKLARRPRSA